MIKRILTFAILVVAAAAAIPAQAVPPASGVFNMARYVPASADAFISIRTDDAFLTESDVLIGKIRGLLGDLGIDAPAMPSFRSFLGTIFGAQTDAEIANVFGWTGDFMALAISQDDSGGNQSVMAAITVTDRSGAQAYIDSSVSANVTSLGTMGRFAVWDDGNNAYMLLADDLLIMAENVAPNALNQLAAENFTRLSEAAGYVAAVGALPESAYSLGAYVSGLTGIAPAVDAVVGNLAMAAGAALLDGITYTLDISAVPQPALMPPLTINPDFARFIPSSAGAAVHGADLTALVNTALDLAGRSTGENTRGRVSGAFALAGLDFDEFLSWIKGDFALFARMDVRSILPSLMGTPPNLRGLPGAVDVALVIEAVKPAKAKAFATSLAAILRAAAAQPGQGLSVSDETINGVPVTVLIADSRTAGLTLSVEFALGASDDVFAFGTANAVRAIFSGTASVLDSPNYAGASRYWLADPNTAWMLDGLTAANFGALAGLAGIPVGPTSRIPAPEEISAIITRIGTFIRYATLSTSVTDDGILLARGTITLGE